MSTTSLKLPDDLKEKATNLAKAQHLSPHAYMIEAIARATELDELHLQFVDNSLAARKQALDSGIGYAAEDVHQDILNKATGGTAHRAKPRSWRE